MRAASSRTVSRGYAFMNPSDSLTYEVFRRTRSAEGQRLYDEAGLEAGALDREDVLSSCEALATKRRWLSKDFSSRSSMVSGRGVRPAGLCEKSPSRRPRMRPSDRDPAGARGAWAHPPLHRPQGRVRPPRSLGRTAAVARGVGDELRDDNDAEGRSRSRSRSRSHCR